MKAKHNIKFISTYKLNQDVLENFFSQLRQIGGVYDHPSALPCLYRIRMMIIGKSPTILQNHTDQNGDKSNNSQEPNEEFLSAAVFAEADLNQTLPETKIMENLNKIFQGIDEKSDDSEIVST
uniref:Transposable element P transposase-like RNase H C-terminal domain-containing protein n=1 Tax=Anopheles stephensi TaxID=30069 RepID=A0A182YRN3_ANOST